jgi:ATP-dependent Clp protease protease subunit
MRTPRINKPKSPTTKLEQIVTNLHLYNLNVFTREIFLHAYYCSDDTEEQGVEYRMATTFEKNIRMLDQENQSNILIHMHTMGGNWNDGMAIYNTIEFTRSPVTILGYCWARSMSSIILQAASKRVLMPDTDFMVHYGTQGDDDHYLAFMSGAEYSKKLTERMLQIYAKKCINAPYFQNKFKPPTEEKVKNFLEREMQKRGDWWMSAEEAVNFGFADGLLGQPGFETMDMIRTNKKLKIER